MSKRMQKRLTIGLVFLVAVAVIFSNITVFVEGADPADGPGATDSAGGSDGDSGSGDGGGDSDAGDGGGNSDSGGGGTEPTQDGDGDGSGTTPSGTEPSQEPDGNSGSESSEDPSSESSEDPSSESSEDPSKDPGSESSEDSSSEQSSEPGNESGNSETANSHTVTFSAATGYTIEVTYGTENTPLTSGETVEKDTVLSIKASKEEEGAAAFSIFIDEEEHQTSGNSITVTYKVTGNVKISVAEQSVQMHTITIIDPLDNMGTGGGAVGGGGISIGGGFDIGGFPGIGPVAPDDNSADDSSQPEESSQGEESKGEEESSQEESQAQESAEESQAQETSEESQENTGESQASGETETSSVSDMASEVSVGGSVLGGLSFINAGTVDEGGEGNNDNGNDEDNNDNATGSDDTIPPGFTTETVGGTDDDGIDPDDLSYKLTVTYEDEQGNTVEVKSGDKVPDGTEITVTSSVDPDSGYPPLVIVIGDETFEPDYDWDTWEEDPLVSFSITYTVDSDITVTAGSGIMATYAQTLTALQANNIVTGTYLNWNGSGNLSLGQLSTSGAPSVNDVRNAIANQYSAVIANRTVTVNMTNAHLSNWSAANWTSFKNNCGVIVNYTYRNTPAGTVQTVTGQFQQYDPTSITFQTLTETSLGSGSYYAVRLNGANFDIPVTMNGILLNGTMAATSTVNITGCRTIDATYPTGTTGNFTHTGAGVMTIQGGTTGYYTKNNATGDVTVTGANTNIYLTSNAPNTNLQTNATISGNATAAGTINHLRANSGLVYIGGNTNSAQLSIIGGARLHIANAAHVLTATSNVIIGNGTASYLSGAGSVNQTGGSLTFQNGNIGYVASNAANGGNYTHATGTPNIVMTGVGNVLPGATLNVTSALAWGTHVSGTNRLTVGYDTTVSTMANRFGTLMATGGFTMSGTVSAPLTVNGKLASAAATPITVNPTTATYATFGNNNATTTAAGANPAVHSDKKIYSLVESSTGAIHIGNINSGSMVGLVSTGGAVTVTNPTNTTIHRVDASGQVTVGAGFRGTINVINSVGYTSAAANGGGTIHTINNNNGGVTIGGNDTIQYFNLFLGNGTHSIAGGNFFYIWGGINSTTAATVASTDITITGLANTQNLRAVFGGGNGNVTVTNAKITLNTIDLTPATAPNLIGLFGGGTGGAVTTNAEIVLGTDRTVSQGDIYLGGYGGDFEFGTFGNVFYAPDALVNGTTFTTNNTEWRVGPLSPTLTPFSNVAGSIGTESKIELKAGQQVTNAIYGGSLGRWHYDQTTPIRDPLNDETATGGAVTLATITIENAAGTRPLQVGTIYGGSKDLSGAGLVSTANINIGNNYATHNTTIGTIYGGSANFSTVNVANIVFGSTSTLSTTTNVTAVYGGGAQVASRAYDGGSKGGSTAGVDGGTTGSGTAHNVNIRFNSMGTGATTALTVGNVWAGSNSNGGTISPYINLNYARTTIGNIYGGGASSGTVTGNMGQGAGHTAVLAGTAPSTPAQGSVIRLDAGIVTSNVYGGASGSGNVTEVWILVPSSAATVSNASTGTGIYNGGTNSSCTVATASMYLYTDPIGASANASASFHGAGSAGTVTNSFIHVRGSTSLTHEVYGAGTNGSTGTGTINIETTGTLTGAIYGGARAGSATTAVSSSVTINIGVEAASAPVINADIYGGSNGATGYVNTVTINLVKGTVGRATTPGPFRIFGGANGGNSTTATNDVKTANIYIHGSTNSVVGTTGSNTHDVIYGGSRGNGNNAGDVETANIYVVGGTTVNGIIHGGSLNGGEVETVNIGIGNTGGIAALTAGTGTVLGDVYGGSLNGNSRTNGNGYVDKTNITIGDASNIGTIGNGSSLTSDVYGGGQGGTAGTTNITMNNSGSNVAGNIYGGGDGASGSNAATVLTKTNVTINNGTVGSLDSGTPQQPITDTGYIYGGGIGATGKTAHVTGTADITSNPTNPTFGAGTTNIQMLGGIVYNDMFGGGTGVAQTANVTQGTALIMLGGNGTANGNVWGHVYGGGDDSHTYRTNVYITDNSFVGRANTTPNIIRWSNVYGGGTGNAAVNGTITTTTTVTVTGTAEIANNVYGGGTNYAGVTGRAPVSGGASAADPSTRVTISSNPIIYGHVYGGGDNNTVSYTLINMSGGTVGSPSGATYGDPHNPITNIFGGGKGTTSGIANITSSTVNVSGGLVTGSVYGGGTGQGHDVRTGNSTAGMNTSTAANGAASAGTTNVTISSVATVNENVFGGGEEMPVTGQAKVTVTGSANGTNSRIGGNVYGGGEDADDNNAQNRSANVGSTSVTISGSVVNYVFGGGYGRSATVGGGTNVAISGASTTIKYDVYGGGSTAQADDSANVTVGGAKIDINDATVVGSVYGGGDNTTIGGNYFSNFHTNSFTHTSTPGFPDAARSGSANVTGNVTVTIANATIGSAVTDGIYGGGNNRLVNSQRSASTVNNSANVLNGNVKLDISGTDLDGDIYGGGDNRVLTPTAGFTITNSTNVTGNVTIEVKTGTTVTGDVYGGSNNTVANPTRVQSSANVTGNVTIDIAGTDIDGDLYGGSNNAAGTVTTITNIIDSANVGSTSPTANGVVDITITGGKVTDIYGGSNNAAIAVGTITDSANVNEVILDISNITVNGDVYGGGNNTGVTLTSVSGSANVTNNVTIKANAALIINGDLYGGGNNAAGTIGSITNSANVGGISPTTNGAVKITVIGGNVTDIYGGGNNAVVNVTTIDKSANVNSVEIDVSGVTIRGDLYGGGDNRTSSATAVVTDSANVTGAVIIKAGTGGVNDIYGGGNNSLTNAVSVNDSVNVNSVTMNLTNVPVRGDIYGGGHNTTNSATSVTVRDSVNVTGAVSITANGGNARDIYGGGNNEQANATSVTNSANVGSVTFNLTGVNIRRDIYGGGNNTTIHAIAITNSANVLTGNVNITIVNSATSNIGTMAGGGSVYGGGNNNASATSGANINNSANISNGSVTINITGGTIGHGTSNTGSGSVYGGGNNSDAAVGVTINNSANIRGSVSITLNGVSVYDDVYGGSNHSTSLTPNVNITVKDSANIFGNTSVTIENGSVIGNDVFGGGGGAGYVGMEASAATYNNANVTGTTAVKIDDSQVDSRNSTSTADMIVSGVHGGGYYGDVFRTTRVEITGSSIKNHVYGGGINSIINNGPGANATVVATTVIVDSSTTKNIYGGSVDDKLSANHGQINGHTNVTVQNGSTTQSIYGGGFNNDNAAANSKNVYIQGYTDVKVSDTTILANGSGTPAVGSDNHSIYGGGVGNNTLQRAEVREHTTVTVARVTFLNTNSHKGTVYGGGHNNQVNGILGTTVYVEGDVINGDVVGGGRGHDAHVKENTHVETILDTVNGITRVTGYVYGAGRDNNMVSGSTNVLIGTGTDVDSSVYGGGDGTRTDIWYYKSALNYGAADVNIRTAVTVKGHVHTDVYGGGIDSTVHGTGVPTSSNSNTVTVIIKNDGTVGDLVSQSVYNNHGTPGGHVFGGSVNTVYNPYTSTVVGKGNATGHDGRGKILGNIRVEINGQIAGNVYGGGEHSFTDGNTDVVVQPETSALDTGIEVWGDVYGGGSDGDVEGRSRVLIARYALVSWGDVYGGGRDADINSKVMAPATHTYGTQVTISGEVRRGNVFGGSRDGNVYNANVYVQVTESGYVTAEAWPDRLTTEAGGPKIIPGSVFPDNKGSSPTGRPNGATGGSVYGGGIASTYQANPSNRFEVEYDTTVIIHGFVGSHVHGGGYQSDVNGNTTGGTTVVVGDNSPGIWTRIGGNVFGGGRYNGDVNGANGTNVTICGDAIVGYFAGHYYTDQNGNTTPFQYYEINDPRITNTNSVPRRYDWEGYGYVFGGGYQGNVGVSSSAHTGAVVTIENGAVIHRDVFGGSYEGSVENVGGTKITIYSNRDNAYPMHPRIPEYRVNANHIPNYTIGHNVYGGSYGGNVIGADGSMIRISGPKARIYNDVFGGGTNGTYPNNDPEDPINDPNGSDFTIGIYSTASTATIENTNIEIWDGANIRERVFGGGQGANCDVTFDTIINIYDAPGATTQTTIGNKELLTQNGDQVNLITDNSQFKLPFNYEENGEAKHNFFDQRKTYKHLGYIYGGGDFADVGQSTSITINDLDQIVFGRISGGNLRLQSGPTNLIREIELRDLGTGTKTLYHDDPLEGYDVIHTIQDFTRTDAYNCYLTVFYNLMATDDNVTVDGNNLPNAPAGFASTELNGYSSNFVMHDGVYNPWRPSTHTVVLVEPRVIFVDFPNFRMETGYTVHLLNGLQKDDGLDTIVLLIDRAHINHASNSKILSGIINEVMINESFNYEQLPETLVPTNIYDKFSTNVVGVNFYIPPRSIEPTDGDDTDKGGTSTPDVGSGFGSGGSGGGGGSRGGSGGSGGGGGGGGGGAGAGAITSALTNPTNVELKEADAKRRAQEAVRSAGAGKTGSIIERNADRVTMATLRAMAEAAAGAGGKAVLYMDTVSSTAVEGRMILDPTKAAQNDGTILTRVYTRQDKVAKTLKRFGSHFSNRVAIASMEHIGPIGMEVRIAAKVDLTDMNVNNLVLYVYNPNSNTYKRLPNQQHVIDSKGYIWFYTTEGGDIIISDGQLLRK